MDGLSGFLEGPRARQAFLLRSLMDPPWALRIQDEAPLTLVALVAGTACVVPADGQVRTLAAGDVAVLRGPEPYLVADRPDRAPQVIVHPDQRCTDRHGRPVTDEMTLGVRTWGNSACGSTVLLTGTYTTDGEVSRRLLAALPAIAVVRADVLDSPLVGLLGTEIAVDLPGQEVVLDRLLDLLLIATLRQWFAEPDSAPPAWYGAHDDEVVGAALRLLQHEPARPWTVGSLATAVGVSRASLARRFTESVGEPPMTFLAGWRMALAADLLAGPGVSVGEVARAVGYQSPFTFSSAFKRHHGVSPSEHRRTAA